MSNHPTTNGDILYMTDEIKERYPYLEKCVREIHQADVLNQYFSYDGTPGQYEQQDNKVDGHKRETPDKPSVHRQLVENKERVKKNEQNKDLGDRTNSHYDSESTVYTREE